MPKNSPGTNPIPIPYPNVTDLGATPYLPAVASPLPKELLPAELQSALVRLGQKYGAGLRVTVTDSEWVEISMENLPAAQLHAQIQSERKVLFGTAESRVQVIQPLRPTGSEIFLHLLSEPQWGNRAMMAAYGK